MLTDDGNLYWPADWGVDGPNDEPTFTVDEVIDVIKTKMMDHFLRGEANRCFAYRDCYNFESLSNGDVEVISGGAVNSWGPLYQVFVNMPLDMWDGLEPPSIGNITDGGVFVIDRPNGNISYVHARPNPGGLPPTISVEKNWPNGFLWHQPFMGETVWRPLPSVDMSIFDPVGP